MNLEDCSDDLRNRYEFSDEQVLDFVCMVITDYDEELLVLAQKLAESGKTWIWQEAQGVLTAVRAVVARLRWNGLKATPHDLNVLDEEEYRREPLLLDLPGVHGFFPYTDKQLLFRVCLFLENLQQGIFDSILPTISGRKRLALAQAMALAEQDVERESAIETELTNMRRGELSKWQCVVRETIASLSRLSGGAVPAAVPFRPKIAA
ncbi:MAG TPA: hypothetical protein VGY56_20660 [Verrucomicrobiae bacterium]|nr:hypothetical protein [Verrucomicrobiae bacterium]